MIIKFDHISFSCGKEQAEALPITAGYEKLFHRLSLRNLSCKNFFFQEFHSDHNIYMYEKAGALPVEITAYDSCFSGRNNMIVENDAIIFYSPDPPKTMAFLMLFGFKEEQTGEERFVLKGNYILGVSVTVRIIKTDYVEWKLDKTGWSSLGFLSSDAEKELSRLSAAGYYVTDVEELQVNNNLMNIGFCRGPFGEIIEIISIKRR